LDQTELPNTSGLAIPTGNAALEEKTPIGLKSGIPDLIEKEITPEITGNVATKITEPTKEPLLNHVIAEKKVPLITKAGIVQRLPLLNTPKLDGTGSGPYRPTFNSGFIGIHFTRQLPLEAQLKSMDSLRQNAGFNFQFMSRNLFPSPLVGGYMGFDFGMQFYGRSKNNPVVLNNTTQDSGYTRLGTLSLDFLVRGHIEFGQYRLKPYVNVFAGPRIYSTNQHVASYLSLKNNESSTDHNASSAVSLLYGAGVGLRYRVSKVVSLDVRGEYMNGTAVNLVNMDKSKFNGLSYDLNKFTVNPEYLQWKVGLLFDLSEDDSKEENSQQSHTNYERQPVYYYYDSVQKRNIPLCPCNCDTADKKSNSEVEPDPLGVQPNTGGTLRSGNSKILFIPGTGFPTGSGSSGSGSSGKGSFPGIKTGGKPKS
jgi:hypothetical protein